MESTRIHRIHKVAFFMAVLLLSVILDLHHASWSLAPLIGFSAGITYWCLYPGYEDSFTFIKSILLMAIALSGIPWTPTTVGIALAELIRHREIIQKEQGRWKTQER